MKKIIFLVVLIFGIQNINAQDTLQIEQKPIVIKDAGYGAGNIEDLYYYVNNNFNYNNVKKEDIPAKVRRKPYFVFYVVFAVSEDGKAFEFSPKEISEDNSFYKEAVRVIASAHWNTATEDDIYKKQFLVLPIRANLMDW